MTAHANARFRPLPVALIVMAVGAAGLLIAFQGWRGRGPDQEVTAAMSRAVTWLEEGKLPYRGSLTDLNSFFPAGTSWLTVPGLLWFEDARLIELTGSGALFLGTLAGVFLLTRRFFGERSALLAVVLYAVSPVPLHLAGVLWPRGHPFFYVWMAYFAARWVAARDGRFLAAALLTWSAGMYVHMELAPAILMVPAIWILARPPVPLSAIGIAALLSLALWAPYLRFQLDRDFIDLRSQLLMQPLADRGTASQPWCGEDPVADPRFRDMVIAGSATSRVATIADLVPANFGTRVLGGEWILLLLLAGGVVTAAVRRAAPAAAGTPWLVPRPLLAGAALIVGAEFIARWVAPPDGRAADALLVVRRVAIWALAVTAVAAVGRARSQAVVLAREWPASDSRVLVIALLVPWAALLLVTEAGRSDRMLGIYSLQVPFIAAFTLAWLDARALAPNRQLVVVLLVVAITAANLVVLQRARDWTVDGWAGAAVEYVAGADYRQLHCP